MQLRHWFLFLLNLFLSSGLFLISLLNSLVIKRLLLNLIILVLIGAWVFKTLINFFSNSPYVSPSKVSKSFYKALLNICCQTFYKTDKSFSLEWSERPVSKVWQPVNDVSMQFGFCDWKQVGVSFYRVQLNRRFAISHLSEYFKSSCLRPLQWTKFQIFVTGDWQIENSVLNVYLTFGGEGAKIIEF